MSEYTGGTGEASSWAGVLRRAAARLRNALRRPSRRSRGRFWRLAVPAVLCAAGLLISATANTARGTNLRTDEDLRLREVIEQRSDSVAELDAQANDLRAENEATTRTLGDSDGQIAAESDRADALRDEAGLTPVTGPGLVVSLDDAPRQPDGSLPDGATVDDVVVHQQDVQSVVNALWAGGAEAMTLMDVRVIATSAVRCVGNTLLLHGRVYSPPFRIAAIGDGTAMLAALDAAPGVRAYRIAADDFGLGYSVDAESQIDMPAYNGPVSLTNAEVAE